MDMDKIDSGYIRKSKKIALVVQKLSSNRLRCYEEYWKSYY